MSFCQITSTLFFCIHIMKNCHRLFRCISNTPFTFLGTNLCKFGIFLRTLGQICTKVVICAIFQKHHVALSKCFWSCSTTLCRSACALWSCSMALCRSACACWSSSTTLCRSAWPRWSISTTLCRSACARWSSSTILRHPDGIFLK